MTPPAAATAAPLAPDRAAELMRLRAATGVGLADIARKTGYSITRLLHLEGGQATVDRDTYLQICAAVDELIMGNGRRPD